MKRQFLWGIGVACLLLTSVNGYKASQASQQSSNPEKPQVVVPCGPIFFPFNSARFNCEHAACGDEVALRMQQDPQATLVIDGHRDSSEKAYISECRVKAALRYLVREKHIEATRIVTRGGFSDTCPHESGDSNLNRRVEFWILPKGATVEDVGLMKRCRKGSTPRVASGAECPAKSRLSGC